MSEVPSQPKVLRREIELDFIRGLAVLLVLDGHATGFLYRIGFPVDAGALGVSMFFVLSGFLVGGILVREWSTRGRIDARRFLIRRGLKIWPQYYCFLIILLLTGHRTVRNLLGNLLNLQNYMGGVAHTWSLAVEEHAYLLLTLVFVLAGRWNISKQTLLYGLLLVAIACGVFRGIMRVHGADVFEATQYRIDGILWGLVLALLFEVYPERFRQLQRQRWLWFAGLILLPSVIYLARSLHFLDMFRSDLLNLFGISSLMLLYRGNARTAAREPGRIYRVVAWVGLYSYGIYLWHVSVFAPLAAVMVRMHLRVPAVVYGLIGATLGGLLGIVATEVIELPTLRLRDRLFPRKVASPLEVGVEEVTT